MSIGVFSKRLQVMKKASHPHNSCWGLVISDNGKLCHFELLFEPDRVLGIYLEIPMPRMAKVHWSEGKISWTSFLQCTSRTCISKRKATFHNNMRAVALFTNFVLYLDRYNIVTGISRMTIYRRRQKFEILDDATNIIDDTQFRLDLRKSSPHNGEVMVMGHLRSLSYNVPRARGCNAIRNADAINTALRWKGTVTCRRPYSVPGPNSLWHIGKLCIIHGIFVVHCTCSG